MELYQSAGRDEEFYYRLHAFITYLKNTNENAWGVDVVKSKDGTKNCVFGHLWDFYNGDNNNVKASRAWDWFESCVASTFALYKVNDGKHEQYNQTSPKNRCIQYLENVFYGKELTTMECMDKCMFTDHKNNNDLTSAYRIYGYDATLGGVLS